MELELEFSGGSGYTFEPTVSPTLLPTATHRALPTETSTGVPEIRSADGSADAKVQLFFWVALFLLGIVAYVFYSMKPRADAYAIDGEDSLYIRMNDLAEDNDAVDSNDDDDIYDRDLLSREDV